MKLPTISYRAIALIAIAVSAMGLIMSPASAASPSGSYMQGQHFGGNLLDNQTRLTAAAQTLGVSVSDLTTALTPPAQGHFNLTNAAAQLSATSGVTITPAQIMAALGMHQGGMSGSSTQWKEGGTSPSHRAGFGNRTSWHSRAGATGKASF